MRTFAVLVLCLLAACNSESTPPIDAALDRAGSSDHATLDRPIAREATPADGSRDAAPRDGASAERANPDVAKPDSNPVPSVPVLPHKGDFLNLGCRTHTYGGLSATARKACRDAVKKRGYTHFYLYAVNEKDYGGPAFDYYGDAVGFQALLKELIADGLAPVVWLFPDDAPVISKTATAALKAKMSALIPAIDSLVSSYCLGLELDEYWDQTKVDELGKHLRTLTTRKIAVHQTGAQWGYAKLTWVDYMILQYGFGKTGAEIQSLTKQCLADLKKPVVAGEYALDDEAKGVLLGDAAVAAGASGFGNGGTP